MAQCIYKTCKDVVSDDGFGTYGPHIKSNFQNKIWNACLVGLSLKSKRFLKGEMKKKHKYKFILKTDFKMK